MTSVTFVAMCCWRSGRAVRITNSGIVGIITCCSCTIGIDGGSPGGRVEVGRGRSSITHDIIKNVLLE